MELSPSRSHFTALGLSIVCHLGGVTLYVALIMDCQRKTIKKGLQCNFRGLYEMSTFPESVGEGFVSISFTNQKLWRL